MTIPSIISQRRRALLVQELERRWPGCGAHTKPNQATKRDAVAWSELLPPQVHADIRAYIAGWDAGIDALSRIIDETTPFPGSNAEKGGQQPLTSAGLRPQRQRQEAARAKLESLFVHSEGEKS